jgi:zinc transport system ATP-binding protein
MPDSAGPDSAISLEGVSFSYETEPVLSDVTLTLRRGSFSCIVGPNGGGKTTLFRLVLGLLKPDKGLVRVLGLPPVQARVQVGYVPQDFAYDKRFPMLVSDVVRMGCLHTPGDRTDAERIEEALTTVGLQHRARDWFGSLSGGQRQRVLIARALATNPGVLLLDEPTANVDAAAQEDILQLLEALRGRQTVMLVTHTASVAARFLETVVCVNRRVHVHPHTDRLDEALMRHIIGLEEPGVCRHA